MKKLFLGAISAIAGAFDFWLFASWINVCCVNLNPQAAPAAWNFFAKFFG